MTEFAIEEVANGCDRHIAVFGKMGSNSGISLRPLMTLPAGRSIYGHDNLAARDTMLETCEAAIMGPDFILTPAILPP